MTLSSTIFCLATAAFFSSIQLGSSQSLAGTRPYLQGARETEEVALRKVSAKKEESAVSVGRSRRYDEVTERVVGERDRERRVQRRRRWKG
jgi:hypothetical protein